jgi:hypothetical protein
MITKLKIDMISFMFTLAKLFYGAQCPELRDRGRYDVAARRVTYGVGPRWWMRYVSDTQDLTMLVDININNTGIAKASYRGKEGTEQWNIELTLGDSNAVAIQDDRFKKPGDLIKFLLEQVDTQCSLPLESDDFHDITVGKFNATKSARILLDTRRKRNAKPDDLGVDVLDGLPAEDDRGLSMSMIYKSIESHDRPYVVMLFDVSDTSGKRARNDRICVTVKSDSFLLRNILGLYNKRLFAKCMNTLGQEAKTFRKSSLSHMHNYVKLSKTTCQAVCIETPRNETTVDTRFRVGDVYTVKDFETAMGGTEYVTVENAGEDVSHNSMFFIIYGR